MTRIITLISFVFLSLISHSQQDLLGNKRIIDTIMSGNDSIVLYADKSWEYLKMIHFDGVTNPYISALASELGWKEDWVNNVPYTYDNDLSAMEDTLWLCVVDDEHNEFCMPHPGMITSTFKYRGKRFHYGIDVDLETGDTLYAAFNGIVRYAQFNEGGFGNLIIIRHFNGLETYYAHLSKLLVSPNQEVSAGDVIGLGGNTGKSYGDHLHFEVRLYGNALDPEEIIDFEKNELKRNNLLVNGQMFTYSKSSKTYSSSSTSSSKTSTTDKNASVHTVTSGDSLYYIALKYGTTVDKLCKLNGIKSSDIIHVGDKIKLK
jgi:murein DD-endopeptidase MepM/ murein hydrolase activator NlpD